MRGLPVSIPEKLSLKDFQDFGDSVSTALVRPYQSIGGVPTADKGKAFGCNPADKKMTMQCLLMTYMMAYFNGNFVDRNGGTYSKPKLGFTISNETIAGSVSVFLEALFDYSIIDGKVGAAPIVYIEDGPAPTKPKWLTKGNNAPTLAGIATGIGAVDPSNSNLPLLEKVVENVKAGRMDAGRLCVVRFLGGAAGDAAQPITGAVVRALGGANIGVSFGLGALGKFSLGDNDTLTKLVDTVVEFLPRRSTELAAMNVLYGVIPDSGALRQALDVAALVPGCR
jgi:hypothetical protein